MSRHALRCLGLAVATLIALTPAVRAQQNARVLPELLPPNTMVQVEPTAIDAPAEIKPIEISPNTNMPKFDAHQEGGNIGIVHLAIESSQYIDPRYIANSQDPDRMGLWERTCEGSSDQVHRLVQDYRNFYLTENMLYVGIAVAIAAPLANTHADVAIRNWYQNGAGNGRSAAADSAANTFRQFGEYQYAIPVYAVLALSAYLCDDSPAMAMVGEFGNRSLRALAVGAPTVGILQIGLGSDRPYTDASHWQPFRADHGASGHAFVGAVPFLTAASMTDNAALKALLVVGSFGPAWSRIHTDDHYFSQVLIGWSIAYLSVQSVNQTEGQYSRFHIVSCDIPKGVGLGVELQY